MGQDNMLNRAALSARGGYPTIPVRVAGGQSKLRSAMRTKRTLAALRGSVHAWMFLETDDGIPQYQDSGYRCGEQNNPFYPDQQYRIVAHQSEKLRKCVSLCGD